MKARWLWGAVALGVAAGCVARGSSSGPPAASSAATAADKPEEVAKLDALIDAAWAAKKLEAAPEVDDETYLRRASIDLIGRVPSAEEVRAFDADTSPRKRASAVDKLLDSPEHAAHLARVWDRLLLGPEVKIRIVDRGALRRWLEQRFAADAPWNDIVRQLIDAKGPTSVGGKAKAAQLADDPERGAEEQKAGINGAANYPLRFAQSPQDMAGQTSRLFLGVQIQCAQCHDHKTEKWTRDDFRAMAAPFTRVKVTPMGREKGDIGVYEIESIDKPARRLLKNEDTAAITKVAPRALDGTDLGGGDPREALAKWVTAPQNAWFAKAMVNRVWAELVGEGFVDPVDDMKASNEAVLPDVLDALAKDFEANHYDLDWLYATICASKPYSRSIDANGSGSRDALFSHASLRPMSADALLDSILVATEVEKRVAERAPERVRLLKTQIRRKMSFVFDDDVESNAEAYDGTLQQAFFTMNGVVPIVATTYADDSLLGRLLQGSDDAAIIDELYLRTLGRHPRPEEVARAKALLVVDTGADPAIPKRDKPAKQGGKKGAKKRAGGGRANLPPRALVSEADGARERGYEDLFWALVNSSEFTFRR